MLNYLIENVSRSNYYGTGLVYLIKIENESTASKML